MYAALAALAVTGVCAPPLLHAQEPATREEQLLRQRQDKAAKLEPYEPGTLEKWIVKIENDRYLERLFTPGSGFHPRLGSFHTGGGIAFGGGYMIRDVPRHSSLDISGAISLKKYWITEAEWDMPRLAGDRLFARVFARRQELPQEDFFGLGPQSLRPSRVSYAYRDTAAGGWLGGWLGPYVRAGAGAEYIAPDLARGRDPRFLSIEEAFDDGEAPGLNAQPDFLRYFTFADVDYSYPTYNPRTGGRYLVSYHRYDDRDLGRYDYGRVDLDLRQYFGFFQERRRIALRALVSASDTTGDNQVPFYFMPTLGGGDTLRGFRQFRFRDRNLLLLQAEYRFEIFTALDMALFYDAGKVASRRRDLDLEDLEHDYGFGFRFGTNRGVFLRIDAAFGSREGKHFWLKFGHVF